MRRKTFSCLILVNKVCGACKFRHCWSNLGLIRPSHRTGRKDDVIVLSTGTCTSVLDTRIADLKYFAGEKVVPIPQEGIITASPMISGAVMFGRAQSQCGVLIEPSSEHTVDSNAAGALTAFKDAIWLVIIFLLPVDLTHRLVGPSSRKRTKLRPHLPGYSRR